MTPDTGLILEAIELNRTELVGIIRALSIMSESMEILSRRLEVIERACTTDREPSPLVEPLNRLIAAVEQQTEVLRDTTDAMHSIAFSVDAQPDAFRVAIREELDAREEE